MSEELHVSGAVCAAQGDLNSFNHATLVLIIPAAWTQTKSESVCAEKEVFNVLIYYFLKLHT